jgi:hypothetical protein
MMGNVQNSDSYTDTFADQQRQMAFIYELYPHYSSYS